MNLLAHVYMAVSLFVNDRAVSVFAILNLLRDQNKYTSKCVVPGSTGQGTFTLLQLFPSWSVICLQHLRPGHRLHSCNIHVLVFRSGGACQPSKVSIYIAPHNNKFTELGSDTK